MLILFSLIGFGFLQLRASEVAFNWAQWRGPGGRGISEEKDFPDEWSDTKNIRWKTSISGRGHSSPIVWGDRIFLTASVEGQVIPGAKPVKHIRKGETFVHPDSTAGDRHHTLKVISLDRATGRILWEKTAYEGAVYDDRHRKNTYASGTPVTDGQHVYAFFESEGLFCYDFSGNLIWKTSLGKIAKMGLGNGTSPILFENLVILQCDQEDGGPGSFIAALDKKTGQEIWRASRQHRKTWATPFLVQGAGRTELVANGSETIVSYDPRTGRELWSCQGVIGHAIPSPVSGFDMIFVSAGYPTKRALGIRLGGSADLTGPSRVVWSYAKGTAYVPSPILYEQYLYLTTDKGLLTCLNPTTGEVKYEGARVPVPATFSSSPVAFSGKILLTSEDGDTFVVKAGPVHEILRTNSIGEPVYASPALSRGEIFIRGERRLYCISNQPAS